MSDYIDENVDQNLIQYFSHQLRSNIIVLNYFINANTSYWNCIKSLIKKTTMAYYSGLCELEDNLQKLKFYCSNSFVRLNEGNIQANTIRWNNNFYLSSS